MSETNRGSQTGFSRRPPAGSMGPGFTTRSTPVHDRPHAHASTLGLSTTPRTPTSGLATTSKAAPALKMQYQASPPIVVHHHLRYNPYDPAVRLNVPVPNAVHATQRPDVGVLRDVMKAAASAEAGEESQIGEIFLEPDGHRRRKEPPVYNKTRRDKATAIAVALDASLREEAVNNYSKDQKSDGDTSHYNFKTWCEVHDAWWSFDGQAMVEALPLTPKKIECVGAALKASGYRSAGNYMTAAKEHHIDSGGEWPASLQLAANRFHHSTLRGIGPPRQSDVLVVEAALLLDVPIDEPIVDNGPSQHEGAGCAIRPLPPRYGGLPRSESTHVGRL